MTLPTDTDPGPSAPRPIASEPPDVIDTIVGIAAGSPLAELRRHRPDFVRYTQGSHDVLLDPADPAGVTLVERALIALRVAVLHEQDALAAHYRGRLEQLGATAGVIAAAGHDPAEGDPGRAPLPVRLKAILGHVRLVSTEPGAATKAHLDALQAAGLSPRDIVTIAQLIAFVSYQSRVAAGLRLLAEDARV